MAQYYRTSAGPKYIEGGIYAPPVEMMQNVIQLKETQRDNAIEKAYGLRDQLEVPYLPFERETVETELKKIDDSIDGLVSRIREKPGDNSYIYDLAKLRRDVAQNRNVGVLGSVGRRALKHDMWEKSPAMLELGKTNPDLKNRFVQNRLEALKASVQADPHADFEGFDPVGRPEVVGLISEMVKLMKGKYQKTKNGLYLVGTEEVTERQLMKMAADAIKRDVKFRGHNRLMGQTLGDAGYLGPDGDDLPLLLYVDGEGNVVDGEQYAKMTPLERNELGIVPNPNSAYANDLSLLSGAYAFSKEDMAPDQFELMDAQHGNQVALANLTHKLRISEMNHSHALQKELLAQKASPEREATARTNFSNMTKTERDKLLDDLRKNCNAAKDKDPNGESIFCMELDAYTAIDTVISLTRHDPDFQNLMASTRVTPEMLVNPDAFPDTPEGRELRTVVKTFLGKYGDQTIKLPSGERPKVVDVIKELGFGENDQKTPLDYIRRYEKQRLKSLGEKGFDTKIENATVHYRVSDYGKWNEKDGIWEYDPEKEASKNNKFSYALFNEIYANLKQEVESSSKKDAKFLQSALAGYKKGMEGTRNGRKRNEALKSVGYPILNQDSRGNIAGTIRTQGNAFEFLVDGEPVDSMTSNAVRKILETANLRHTKAYGLLGTDRGKLGIHYDLTSNDKGGLEIEVKNGKKVTKRVIKTITAVVKPDHGYVSDVLHTNIFDGVSPESEYRSISYDPEAVKINAELNKAVPEGGHVFVLYKYGSKRFKIERVEGDAYYLWPEDSDMQPGRRVHAVKDRSLSNLLSAIKEAAKADLEGLRNAQAEHDEYKKSGMVTAAPATGGNGAK